MMSRRRRLAVAVLIGTVLLCVVAIPGLIDTWDVENAGALGFSGFGLVASLIFAFSGGLLALKRSENPVGWLFAAVGGSFAVITLIDVYAIAPLLEGSESDVVYFFAWLNSWSWIIFLGLIAFAVLLFPTGTLPSPGWRVPARVLFGGFLYGCVSFAVAPGPLNNLPPDYQNRFALPEGPFTEAVVYAGMLAFVGSLVIACIGTVQRYRASRGLQRQQMKLFAFAAATLAVSMVMVVVSELGAPWLANPAELITSMATMSIPVAMTVAILRYRLYDIDLIINRALVYGALSSVLALVYLGGVVLLQQLLAPLTADSDAAIAASTLAVAGLFRPLRTWIQRFIDRRFYRRKYDAAETLAEFAARLRNQVDLDALSGELLRAAGSTVQPSHASLWLRPPPEVAS